MALTDEQLYNYSFDKENNYHLLCTLEYRYHRFSNSLVIKYKALFFNSEYRVGKNVFQGR